MSSLKDISGAHRIAALLLSLDEPSRVALLSKLNEGVAERVADAMISLDPRLTEAGAVDELKRDLAKALNGPQTVRPRKPAEVQGMLDASFGPGSGARVLDAILDRRRSSRPFIEVEKLDPLDVGRALREESDAVAALVLAYLDPAASAKILTLFDEERAFAVVKGIAFLEPPNATILQTIADNLLARIQAMPKVVGTVDPTQKLRNVSDVLKESSPDMEKGVISSVAESDEAAAQEIREFMFTWEDIASIDTRTMQKILGTVDTKTLSVALKGCSPPVEESLMGNLSSRVKEMVAEEREMSGPLPMSEVLGAREEILKSIRVLIEGGEYRPSRGGDDLVE